MLSFSIKERQKDGKWQFVKLESLAGKTVRDVFKAFDGREIVAEFNFDKETCYFTGTALWLERMAQKGRAISFSGAIKKLEEINPELLEERIPDLDLVASVFPGSSFESFTACEK